MAGALAVAWTGLAQPGGWDLVPLPCAVLLLTAAWAARVQIRWWGVLVALAGGLPCATLVEHFGAWVAPVIAGLVWVVCTPIARAARRG